MGNRAAAGTPTYGPVEQCVPLSYELILTTGSVKCYTIHGFESQKTSIES